jgi:transposase
VYPPLFAIAQVKLGISRREPTSDSHLRAALDKAVAENRELRETIETLREENKALREADATRTEQLDSLAAKIAGLERKLGQNSSNSSLPPSSDRGPRQPKPESPNRAARRALGRKPGKQPGSPGHHLAQVEHPDHVEVHAPPCCGSCGGDLGAAAVTAVEKRQVFDLPEPRLESTEHQAETRLCRCGTTTKADFPPEARAYACYGSRVRANALYLMSRQHVPFERATEAMRDLFGVDVSTGFLDRLYSEGAAGLEAFLAAVTEQLRVADVVHVDETSDRLGKKSVWYHVACTELLTLLHADVTRGYDGIERTGLFPGFSGVVVHDRLDWYFSYGNATHAVCGAHLVRNLKSVGVVKSQQEWATAMTELLLEMKKAAEAAREKGRKAVYWRDLKAYMKRYDKICAAALAANPQAASGRKRNEVERESFNLATAFTTLKDEICLYAKDLRVPFTNNIAERDLRMAKIHRKVSSCFRSLEGAERLGAVRSYISTAMKQGLDPMAVLVRLFAGDAWIPQRA